MTAEMPARLVLPLPPLAQLLWGWSFTTRLCAALWREMENLGRELLRRDVPDCYRQREDKKFWDHYRAHPDANRGVSVSASLMTSECRTLPEAVSRSVNWDLSEPIHQAWVAHHFAVYSQSIYLAAISDVLTKCVEDHGVSDSGYHVVVNLDGQLWTRHSPSLWHPATEMKIGEGMFNAVAGAEHLALEHWQQGKNTNR